MTIVNMFAAKTQLSRLVEAVEAGIVIARNGRPAARLLPIARKQTGKRIGVAKGKFAMPDTIDADEDQIAVLFTGAGD